MFEDTYKWKLAELSIKAHLGAGASLTVSTKENNESDYMQIGTPLNISGYQTKLIRPKAGIRNGGYSWIKLDMVGQVDITGLETVLLRGSKK